MANQHEPKPCRSNINKTSKCGHSVTHFITRTADASPCPIKPVDQSNPSENFPVIINKQSEDKKHLNHNSRTPNARNSKVSSALFATARRHLKSLKPLKNLHSEIITQNSTSKGKPQNKKRNHQKSPQPNQ